MKRDLWLLLFGILGGLFGAGLLYLVATPPRGQVVTLLPPPTPAPIMVYVSGGVNQPGVVALPVDSRIQEAIEAAGGVAIDGDASRLNLAAPLYDGDQVIVPVLPPTALPNQVAPAERSAALPMLPQVGQSASTAQPQGTLLININTATVDELESLPGIGPVTAQKIIDHRTQYGSFQTIEAIMDVKGIGPATFERIKELITVDYIP